MHLAKTSCDRSCPHHSNFIVSTSTLITFGLYLVTLLGIGLYFYRKTETLSDYILGGRTLGSGVTALSAGASDMSGWLLMGLPGAVYAYGINQIWLAFGLILGSLVNWTLVAKRLRVYSEIAQNAITIPDYLEYRFRENGHILRALSALVILLFFAIYTSSGLVAGATLFETTFELDRNIALITGTLIIVSYTFLGGYAAVSWTDFFQGLLMLGALVAAPLLLLGDLPFNKATEVIRDIDPTRLQLFHNMGWAGILSLMAWGLGYMGQPHILARFMGIRSATLIPRATGIAMTWMILSLAGAVFVGLMGIAALAQSPLPDGQQESVFLELTSLLFHPWMAGILLAAILSAVMSTVDSQLLVCSSAIAEDLYKPFFNPGASQRELVLISRSAVLLVAVIAFVIALQPDNLILDLVAYAWAGFGASFGPVILFSLFWRDMTAKSAAAGILTGAITILLWESFAPTIASSGTGWIANIASLYSMIPGFLLSSAAVWLTGKTGAPPSEEVILQHERMVQACESPK